MTMSALEALTQRVSSKALVAPAPDEFELHSILSAAVRAPDHGRLRPWRFIVIRDEGLNSFGELMAQSLLKRKPEATAVELDRERGKPLRAPLIVVVAAKVKEDSPIPTIEQVFAAVASAQNIMLAAYATGFGCAWKTGDAAYADDVKEAFGLQRADAIVGFMYLGTNASPLPPAQEQDVYTYVSEFPA